MRVMVIGAAGMIGERLAGELRRAGVGGHQVAELVGVDVVTPSQVYDHVLCGDIADPDFVDLVASSAPDVVFHLAAVVSGQAEAEFELGYDVNVHGTWHLLEAARVAPQWCPRLVFASSIAVFGAPLPPVIGDDHRASPRSSYGTQKAIGELLLADYSRRGHLDGIALRLPTVVVRPGRANQAASSFFSSIVREPLDGGHATIPVDRSLVHWIASPATVVAQLLHAAALPSSTFGIERALTMPGVAVSVAEIVAAVERAGGAAVVGRIADEPDPAVAAIVASWPERFDTARADALGFPVDTGIDDIVARHMADVAATQRPGGAASGDAVSADGDEDDDDDDVTGMAMHRLVEASPPDGTGAVQPMTTQDDAASAVIAKVRSFIETLDTDERQVFAAMLAPAVAEAWADEPEVEGFGAVWTPTRVQDHLNRAIRQQRFHIDRADDA